MKSHKGLIVLRVALSTAMGVTHVLFAHQAEASFWTQRADAVRRMRSEAPPTPQGGGLLAQLLTNPTHGIVAEGFSRPSPALTNGSFPAPLRDEATDLLTAVLPRATIRSYADAGPDSPLVIHVQDVHGHVGAQRNIAGILSELILHRPGAPLLLEGGAGPIALPPHGTASLQSIKGTAAFFFNAGVISGAEVAVLTAPKGISVFGAEDPALYLANVKAVREAAPRREELAKRIATWQSQVEARANQIFNPSLLQLNKESQRWASGAAGLDDHVAFLWEQKDSGNYPELEKYRKASQCEKAINLSLVQRDRAALLTALEEKLSKTTASELAQAALAYRSGTLRPGDFYRTFRKTIQRSGLALTHYPAFESYVRYAILADDIRPEALHQEMETLEASLWNRWARTEEEQRLVSLIHDLRMANGLAKLTLTPEEWMSYQSCSAQVNRLPTRMEKISAQEPLPEWSETLAPFKQFYQVAEARNQALAQNVWRVLPSKWAHRPMAVLVAGGFHSAGLASVFAQHHISVLTLSPKLEDVSGGTPFDLFTRDRTPLEQLFESPRIGLSETLALQPIGDKSTPRAEMVTALTPRLNHLLDKGDGKAGPAYWMDMGNPVLLAVTNEALSQEDLTRIANGRTIVAEDVPTSLDPKESTGDKPAPRIYVFSNRENVGQRFLRSIGSFFKGTHPWVTRLLGAALLGAFLLPLTPSPAAHAATFFNAGESVQVTVQKNEHLWGVAQRVLQAKGVRATNKAILHMVQDLTKANTHHIKNPNIIYPGVAYTIPAQHLTPAVTQTLTGETPETKGDSPIQNHVSNEKTAAGDTLSTNPRNPLPTATPASDPLIHGPAGPSPHFSSPEIRETPSPAGPEHKGYDISFFLVIASAYVLRASRSFSSTPLFDAIQSSTRRLTEATVRAKNTAARILTAPRTIPPSLRFLAIAGVVAGLFFLLPFNSGLTFLSDQMTSILPSAGSDAVRSYLSNQWPVEMGLAIALGMASYFIWWRGKEVDLGAVEKTDPRLMDWISKLEEMRTVTDAERLESEYLLPLLNSLQALTLNHQVTAASLSDRGMVEKQIDVYRSISRLSRDTVSLLDQQYQDELWRGGDTRERIMDIREKLFLYELYALKVSHALVNASVAHWAFSNFDNHSSWFERWKLGTILRSVRGVQTMIERSTLSFNRTMFQDKPGAGERIWDRAADFSAVRLGNTLIPGLYSENNIDLLSQTFNGLREKAKTKNLSDMTVKDLHRKGLSTMMGLLFWSVTISMTLSFGHALLAFLTGLGANMALFRLQASGTRRDTFYREGLAHWTRINLLKSHPNGRLKPDGRTLGEDPFHLDRHSIQFNFQKAQTALQTELKAATPSADLLLLVAKNERERTYYESRKNDARFFRPDVPVLVLSVPEEEGSLLAYATAALYPSSAEFTALTARYPHLRNRQPWELRIGTLVSKESRVEDVALPLNKLQGLDHYFHPELLTDTSVLDLGIMNIYRATQESAQKGLGGMALRWADRAYIGPVHTGEGHGITLDTFWANRAEMERFKFGAVVATPGKPMKLIRMNGMNGKDEDTNTFRVLGDKHPGRIYDWTNRKLDQFQGFSGEGFFALDEEGFLAQTKFLSSLHKRYHQLKTKPPLDLLMNFLIPAQIARRHREVPATVSQKIATYFAQNGFLTHSSRTADLYRFNLKNAKKATLFSRGNWAFGLNANPVEGFFYGGGADSKTEDEQKAGIPSPQKEKGSFRAHAQQAFGTLLLPLMALGTAISQWTPRGALAALSIPLLATWLLISPMGLMASRISAAGESSAHSFTRKFHTQNVSPPFELQRMASPPLDGPPVRAGRSRLMRNKRTVLPNRGNGPETKDITVDMWSHPEVTLEMIEAAVNELKKDSAPGSENARKALARLGLALIGATPLQNNLLEGLDVNKTRRILQRTAPGVWAGDRKETGRLGAAGIVRLTALRSLAHQVAEIRRGASIGNSLDTALDQTAYLAGLAGLSGTDVKDMHALMAIMGGVEGEKGEESWASAWDRGQMERESLVAKATPQIIPAQSSESTFTALRVTELMPNAQSTAAQRKALLASLHRMASLSPSTKDLLVINGSAAKGRDENTVRKILLDQLKDPSLEPYVAAIPLVILPEERFAPESVMNQLPNEYTRFSMDLITVNSAAVLVDPLRTETPYRVLLLELLGGELFHVDLMNVARQALQAARVVSTGA